MEPFVPVWHKATTTAECRLQNRMESLWRRQGAAFLRARYFSLELIQMFTGFIWEIIQPPQSLNQSHKTPQGRKGTETLKWPYVHGKLQNLLGKAPQHLCLEKSTTLTLTQSVFSAETSSIKDCTTPLPVIMKMYFLIHIQKKKEAAFKLWLLDWQKEGWGGLQYTKKEVARAFTFTKPVFPLFLLK